MEAWMLIWIGSVFMCMAGAWPLTFPRYVAVMTAMIFALIAGMIRGAG